MKREKLLKKSKGKMTLPCIQETLSKGVVSEEKVAGIVYQCEEKEAKNQKEEPTETLSVKYFKKSEIGKGHLLVSCLASKKKSSSFMVQKFIRPMKDHNSRLQSPDLIEVYWSPQFCRVVKKTNLHHTDDQMVSVGKRMCTFDGSDKYSRTGNRGSLRGSLLEHSHQIGRAAVLQSSQTYRGVDCRIDCDSSDDSLF